MKLRHLLLGIAILLSAAILAGVGAYLKYDVLKPFDLYQDKSVFELPFLMYSDEYLRFMVEHAEEMKQMEQEITSTVPSDTTDQTEGSTVPSQSTTVPSETDANPSESQTKPSENPPTQPSHSETTVSSGPVEGSTSSSSAPTTAPSTGPTTAPTTEPTAAPTTTPPVSTSVTAPPTTAPAPAKPNFDFPSGVDDFWFDNVLFIGDSRVVGLREYARSGNADYFCDVGMNLLSYDDKTLSDKNFPAQTLESLLNSRKYDKIIVNFGLNECGFNDYSFKLLYKKLVNMLREKQPNAVIILQGIMSVTRSKASTASYLHPTFIAARSSYIKSLTDGKTVFYIDCNPYFSDEDGYLYTSITNDGYHPTIIGYRYWRDWIAFALDELGL